MASRFDLLYGGPGSGKSLALIKLIENMHRQHPDRVARVAVGDGSGEMYRTSGLVEAGIVKLTEFPNRPFPFTTAQQISEGWVARDEDDPTSPLVKLSDADRAKTGLWIFEGAAVMGEYMMGDVEGGLAYRAAHGETVGGQDTNARITDSQDYVFGGNSPAHYGFGQKYLRSNCLRSKALTNWVIWTTHERIDDGERGGGLKPGQGEKVRVDEKMIGPEFIGKALTASISREFGNTLHFVLATKKEAKGTDPVSGKTQYIDKNEYRVYTRDHFDPDGIVALKYRAVCRVSGNPLAVKDYYVSDQPGEALLEFYRALHEANKRPATT